MASRSVSAAPRPPYLALALLLLLGFALRVYRIDAQSLWYDEAVTAQVVQQGMGELARWTADDIQPPLYYAAVAGWTQFAGLNEAALRLPSAFCGVLMIALAWALGRRLFGRTAGVLAALLAALHPLWIYYSQEARMYTLLTALGMAAAYALLRAAAERRDRARLAWWAGFTLAAIALLYTHYFAAFLLLAFGVWFLATVLVRRDRRRRRLLEGAIVVLIVALAYLPWLPNALRRFRVDTSYWQGALKLDEALRHVAISFTTGETVLEAQTAPLAGLVGVIAVACFVALLLATRRRARSETGLSGEMSGWARSKTGPSGGAVSGLSLLLVVLWLLVPLVLILALSYRTPKFNPRYLMLASPALVLLLAGGLALPFDGSRTRWTRALAGVGLAAVMAMSLLAVRNWYTDPAFTKDNWRGAAAYVRSQIQPGEAVVLVSGHAAPAWRYYAPDLEPVRLPESEILDVDAVLDGAGVATRLSEALAGKSGAWLVQWQEEVVDPTGVTPFWLAQAGDEAPHPSTFWGLDTVRHFRLQDALPDTLTAETPLDANFDGQVTLVGASQPDCQPRTGDLPCPVYLFWQAQQPLSADLKLSASLVDQAGNVWSPALEQRLSAYEYPTFRWPAGVTVLSRLDFAPFPGTPPGDYSLRVGVYTLDEVNATTHSLDLLDAAGAAAGRWALVPARVDQVTPGQVADGEQPAIAAAPAVDLVRSAAAAAGVAPGAPLAVDLWWRASGQPAADYQIRWQWQNAAGERGASGTAPVAGEAFPTPRWQAGDLVHSQLAVSAPPDAAPGPWTLLVGLSEAGADDAFAGETATIPVEILASGSVFQAPPVQFPANAPLGDQITLVGVSTVTGTVAPGSTAPATVVWQASGPAERSYTAFVHLLDAEGRVVAQDDHLPLRGARPTNTWLPGEVIVDQHSLALPPDLPPGEYRLEVGLYDAALPDLPRPGEAVVLGKVIVR